MDLASKGKNLTNFEVRWKKPKELVSKGCLRHLKIGIFTEVKDRLKSRWKINIFWKNCCFEVQWVSFQVFWVTFRFSYLGYLPLMCALFHSIMYFFASTPVQKIFVVLFQSFDKDFPFLQTFFPLQYAFKSCFLKRSLSCLGPMNGTLSTIDFNLMVSIFDFLFSGTNWLI